MHIVVILNHEFDRIYVVKTRKEISMKGYINISFQKAAESHLPHLETKEGIYFSMDDMDGLHVWNFKYRYI